ncbi:Uncharacterized protein SCF082_LOCUS37695 [Durusdinium trenchii]|uniref:Uncharacterized protein n=1 Tax=Durusdinium trenchii TaxID=1381693 RepID=A0ABP0PSD8_9DINO
MLFLLVVPIGLIAVAAQQVANDSWRLASLGSLIAATVYFGSFALGRAIADSFYFSWFAVGFGTLTFFTFGGFFCQFVWIVEPFEFTATSVVMLTVSAVPSITLAFLFGKWQSSRHVLAVLSDEEGGWCGSALPKTRWKRIALIVSLFIVELGILAAYGLAVYMLDSRPAVKNVGFVLVIGVVILDAMVWHVWYLGLVTDAAETAVLMVLARVSACVWGEDYWLMGHSGVFLAMVMRVGYVTVDMLVPAPDSPKVRRQHAAAEILQTLQAKMADSGGGGGEAGGARGTCGRGPSGVSW